jgi:hypothetical protein
MSLLRVRWGGEEKESEREAIMYSRGAGAAKLCLTLEVKVVGMREVDGRLHCGWTRSMVV